MPADVNGVITSLRAECIQIVNPLKPSLLEPGVLCYRRPEISAEECRRILEAIREGKGRSQILKAAPRRKTYILTFPVSSESRTVVIKEFLNRGLLDSVKDWIRPRPSRRAWKAANKAVELEVHTPAPLALIEIPRSHSAYFVMQFLDGWKNLKQIFNQSPGGCPDGQQRTERKSLIACLASALRRFHDTGVYVPDLVPSNILAQRQGDRWGIAFVDLDAAKFRSRLSLSDRLKTLGRLNATIAPFLSSSERLRALHLYAGQEQHFLERRAIARILAATSALTGR